MADNDTSFQPVATGPVMPSNGSSFQPEQPLDMGKVRSPNALLEFLTRGLKRPPDPRSKNFDAESDSFAPEVVKGVAAGVAPAPKDAITQLIGQKIPGKMMEFAVGAKDPMNGLGTRLLNQGLWGTRGMMAKQAVKAFPKAESMVQEAIPQLEGQVGPEASAGAIRKLAEPFKAPPDVMPQPSANAPFVNLAERRANEALARGPLSPADALATSRAIAKPAYNNGMPLQAFKKQLSAAEAKALKDELKSMGTKQGVPGVSEGLANEQALYQAQKALSKNPSLMDRLADIIKSTTAAGAAAKAGGGPVSSGAAALLTTPAGLSTSAQALRFTAPPTIETLRRGLLLNLPNSSQGSSSFKPTTDSGP